jgi:hypothetical protein
MMGHRDEIKTGDELDLVTRCRRVLCFMHRPGVCRRIKNAINRRARYSAKDAIRSYELQQQFEREDTTPCWCSASAGWRCGSATASPERSDR